MVIASLRPRNEPSASCSPAILFRTGACWATQLILRCPSGAREGSFMRDSRIMALLLDVLSRKPESGPSTSGLVYRQAKSDAAVPVSWLEWHHREGTQIQYRRRLGELPGYPGGMAGLRLRDASGRRALPFEALGRALLPGHGRERAAHDLLPLRVQRGSPKGGA